MVREASVAYNNLQNLTELLPEFRKNAAVVLKSSRKDLQAKIDAAQKEYDDASEEYNVLNKEYNTTLYQIIPNLQSEIRKLELYYDADGTQIYDPNNGGDIVSAELYIKERIDYYETQINYNQAAIDRAEAILKDISKAPDVLASYYTTIIKEYKEHIALNKVEIEKRNAELSASETLAASLKAAIDSLMAE